MDNKAKRIGKIVLCALMLAVAGRPVVVEASTAINLPADPSFGTPQNHSFRAKSAAHAPRIKRQSNHRLSKLKLLPKNTVDLYHFDPQVAKLQFQRGANHAAACPSADRSRSPQNFLVLRI